MRDKQSPSEIVFLFGAGASVKAGVPDTVEFVQKFQQSIKSPVEKKTVDRIVTILKDWTSRDSKVDIELLLETLTKLDSWEQEPLLKFFTGCEFTLKNYPKKPPIIEKLRDFIKSKAIIRSPENVRYLDPLRGFIQEHRPLDIISVNYDTCIEQFCNDYQLSYEDGFDVNWNPRVFEQENVDIRLYKLHGSVIWYRGHTANYIKLPIMTAQANIHLITGERAESLMLYPMQKSDYAEPLLELLVRVKDVLKHEGCKFLVVVGYSFRDDHITRIILDAARRNRELRVVLVDPNAAQIYEERLKYYDRTAKTPSHLAGRVVCLPYRFEDVLPHLKDEYLQNLRLAVGKTSECTRNEIKGDRIVNWTECLRPLADAEYVDKITELLATKIDITSTENYGLCIEVLLKTALNLLVNKRMAEANEYIIKVKECLWNLLSPSKIEIRSGGTQIYLRFNLWRKESDDNIVGVAKFIQEQFAYINSRGKMTVNSRLETFEFFKKISLYLSSYPAHNIDFKDFVAKHSEKEYVEDIEQLKTSHLEYSRNQNIDTEQILRDRIRNTFEHAIQNRLG